MLVIIRKASSWFKHQPVGVRVALITAGVTLFTAALGFIKVSLFPPSSKAERTIVDGISINEVKDESGVKIDNIKGDKIVIYNPDVQTDTKSKPQDEAYRRSLEELIRILNLRAERIIQAASEGAMTPNPYRDLPIDEFKELHKDHIDALSRGQFLFALRTSSEIRQLLKESDPFVYFTPPDYTTWYPGVAFMAKLYYVSKKHAQVNEYIDFSYIDRLIEELRSGRHVAWDEYSDFYIGVDYAHRSQIPSQDQILSLLVEALHDKDESVRRDAARALVAIGEPAVWELWWRLIAKATAENASEDFRRDIIQILKEIATPEALQAVEEYEKHRQIP